MALLLCMGADNYTQGSKAANLENVRCQLFLWVGYNGKCMQRKQDVIIKVYRQITRVLDTIGK